MRLVFLFCLLMLITVSCHKDPSVPSIAQSGLLFKIINKVNGKDFLLKQKYLTPAGDTFTVDNFKYYISNIALQNSKDGSFYSVPESYYLFDASKGNVLNVPIKDIPSADYNQVNFSIGVDDVRNHTGAQTGALDATVNSDMFWGWNAGYKFLLLEGSYYSSSSHAYMPLVIHIGSDENFKNEFFNTYTNGWNSDIIINPGKTTEVDIIFNIEQLFKTIDLDVANNVQGGSEATVYANNYATMPQLSGIK